MVGMTRAQINPSANAQVADFVPLDERRVTANYLREGAEAAVVEQHHRTGVARRNERERGLHVGAQNTTAASPPAMASRRTPDGLKRVAT